VLRTERIAHRGTAALRDFGPAYDGFGSNSEVLFDFEHVRFYAESGNPRPTASSSNATISLSDHFTLQAPRAPEALGLMV
jgi:hypothetical protein